jgi:hypothetical protein
LTNLRRIADPAVTDLTIDEDNAAA